jgi:hypothetical protein
MLLVLYYTMNFLLYYCVTPNLGYLRNYIKCKPFHLGTYMRTPIAYLLIHGWLCLNDVRNIVYKTLIYERWFWFVYKTFKACINGDYRKKNIHKSIDDKQ